MFLCAADRQSSKNHCASLKWLLPFLSQTLKKKLHKKIYGTVKAEKPRYKCPIHQGKQLSFLAVLCPALQQQGCWLWWKCLVAGQHNYNGASHHVPRGVPAMSHRHCNKQGKLRQ